MKEDTDLPPLRETLYCILAILAVVVIAAAVHTDWLPGIGP